MSSIGTRRSRLRLLAAALVVSSAAACGSSGGDEGGGAIEDVDTTALEDSDVFTRTTETSSEPVGPPPSEAISTEQSDRTPATRAPASGVSITQIDLDSGTVTITNHGTLDVDLGEIWICAFPDYDRLDAQTLGGGDSVTVPNPHLSSADDGELALYRTDEFDSPDAILSYVEWGSPDHPRSSVAAEAGLWGGDAVDAGLELGTGGVFAADAGIWSVLRPLPGDSTIAPDPDPPPDDYSPPPPEPPTPTAPPAPPPPDEY